MTGSLVAVHSFGGAEPAGTPTARSASGGFGAWEVVPAASGGGMPQCSYAARRLLCARPGLVFALDPADGGTLWRHPVEEAVRDEPPVVSGGLVQPEVGLLGPLEALDPATGEPAWQEEMPAYDGLRTVGDMLLLTRADGMVTGVDSATGRTKWARRIPGQAVPYFTSFAGERRPAAYATSPSADGRRTRVTAVDPASGDVRWDTELAGALKPVGPRTVPCSSSPKGRPTATSGAWSATRPPPGRPGGWCCRSRWSRPRPGCTGTRCTSWARAARWWPPTWRRGSRRGGWRRV